MVFASFANDTKFCPRFYSQDLLEFDSLSRDWILKLDANANFRPDSNFRKHTKFRYS
jgi:hypothetical protein